MSVTAAIVASGLEVRREELVALTHLDLEVPQGTSVSVIGPNGSGKSTLLETLTGLHHVHAGSLEITGTRPALVPQTTHVDPSLPLTVRDTVSIARYATLGLFGRFRERDYAAVQRALDRLGIADLADRQLRELSGGQRQRAMVAQGLAQDADLLLLDEPLIGLDMTSRQLILQIVDEQVAKNQTVIVTTHDLDDARRSDMVLLLDTEPIAVGTPSEILVAEHLRRAFGGRFTQVGDELILDDPHHSH